MCDRSISDYPISQTTTKKTGWRKIIIVDQLLNQDYIDRSIKDWRVKFSGRMTEESIEWWKGLGEELQVDIETIVDEES